MRSAIFQKKERKTKQEMKNKWTENGGGVYGWISKQHKDFTVFRYIILKPISARKKYNMFPNFQHR